MLTKTSISIIPQKEKENIKFSRMSVCPKSNKRSVLQGHHHHAKNFMNFIGYESKLKKLCKFNIANIFIVVTNGHFSLTSWTHFHTHKKGKWVRLVRLEWPLVTTLNTRYLASIVQHSVHIPVLPSITLRLLSARFGAYPVEIILVVHSWQICPQDQLPQNQLPMGQLPPDELIPRGQLSI